MMKKEKIDTTTATIKIQQVVSGLGREKSQIATLKGLGLNKVNKISELENTSSVRGMVEKVKHLLRILK
jgi:large subunit ribosomal protein L30